MKRILVAVLSLVSLIAPNWATAQSNSLVSNWTKNAVIYEVNVRQFSADSQISSVTKAIPRLKALGVSVIWLMPIYPIGKVKAAGALGSPYAVANYREVNPEFGTDADLHELVNTIHANGMHIILDWVANHTAWDNPWVSNHPDWYTQRNGEIIAPANTNWLDVADLNYSNQDMRAEMISAMGYWVNSFDIDGFRCDAAGMVPQDFWEQARVELDKSKELFMLAEDNSSFGLLDKAFNANYNWRLRDTLKSLASGFSDPTELKVQQTIQEMSYPSNTYPMNFITNHDDNSWSGTVDKQYGKAEDAMAALTYTLPGTPLIYNGQEIGLYRQLKFFEKDPINWTQDAHNAVLKTQLYKRLNSLKRNNPALYSGNGAKANFIKISNSQVIAFTRVSGSSKVLVLVNLSSKGQSVKISGFSGKFYAFGTTKPVTLAKNFTVSLKAKGFAIWSTKP